MKPPLFLFMTNKFTKIAHYGWLGILFLAPIILWLIPSTTFDAHSQDDFSICPSKFIFDFECLGCGMTRAVLHFHHFEFSEGVYYNTGVLVIYPALIALWFMLVFKSWKQLNISRFFK